MSQTLSIRFHSRYFGEEQINKRVVHTLIESGVPSGYARSVERKAGFRQF